MNESPAKNFLERLSNTRLVRYLLLFALGWATVMVLAYFETVIVTFIFAAIIAFLLNYPVRWLSRFLPRGIAASLVFLLSLLILTGLIGTLGFAILSQAQQLLEQAPQIFDQAASSLNRIQNQLRQWNFQVDFDTLQEQLREQALAGVGIGFATLQGMLANFVDLVIIAVIAFFMLLDGKRIWDFVLKAFPEHFRPRITEAFQHNFIGFFWGRLLLSIFFGVSAWVIFIILDLPLALVLAAIAGVFDLIPGIGATIGIALISLVILPQGILLTLKVLVGCILLQQVEENLLMPRIMQGSLNLNPVFMFFALLIGARVAGLVGVFLSVPLAGVLVNLFDIQEMQQQR